MSYGRNKNLHNMKILITILIIVIGLSLLTRAIPFCASQENLLEKFKTAGITLTDNYYDNEGYKVHYVTVGDPTKPAVLFIHGSPGSWDTFVNFLTDADLAKDSYMIAVDRPGYRDTGGKPLNSADEQAHMLLPLLDKITGKVIVVSHSYGGPIATELVLHAPEKIDSVILLSPTLEPAGEEHNYLKRISQVVALTPIIRNLINPNLYNAAVELRGIPTEMRATEEDMKSITVPVTIIHGDADKIAPVSNIEYVKTHFTGTKLKVIEVADMTHSIPWDNVEIVKKEIVSNLSDFNLRNP